MLAVRSLPALMLDVWSWLLSGGACAAPDSGCTSSAAGVAGAPKDRASHVKYTAGLSGRGLILQKHMLRVGC